MSQEEHATHSDPELVPENVEFLEIIGGWDSNVGIDTVQSLLYLIRTKDQDWLEAVAKYSNQIISRNYVASIPRHGSKREAAARLVDAYVRSRVHYEWPVRPYRSGLLAKGELEGIVGAIAELLERNSEMAAEKQRRREAPIIKMARELGLDPRPAGQNDSARMANCPQSSNHWIMISSEHDTFGCGYCRRKGGPQELRAFCNDVRHRHIRS
jgi:hypothetical protein